MSLWRWKMSSQVPRPREPMTSAPMLAAMKILSTCCPATFTAVPPRRTANAIHAFWVPVGDWIPTIFAMKPAAPSATVAIAITRVHMYTQPANQP